MEGGANSRELPLNRPFGMRGGPFLVRMLTPPEVGGDPPRGVDEVHHGGFMSLTKKIVSVAAGVALVAGAGAIAASPVSASSHKALPKTTGKTIIDLKPEIAAALAGAGIGIRATAPATFVTNPKVMIGFPVTGVKGNGISHSGAITFYSGANTTGVTGENPIITLNDDKTATITLSVSGSPIPLLYTKHEGVKYSSWKIDKSHSKWVVKRTVALAGDVHLTTNKAIVDLLNNALGTTAFVADLGLGTTRTTVTEIRTCKKNTTAACKAAGA